MRNKVKRNDMRRLTAVLLMLLMITGSFSVAASAQEVPEAENTEITDTAPVQSEPSVEAQTPAADAAQTQAGSSPEESSSTPEETQPAEETVQTAEGVQEEAAQAAESGDGTVSADNNAAAVQSQAISSEAKAADAGSHDVTFNFDKLPDGMSLAFKITSNNTTTEYVYDGSAVRDTTNDKDVTDAVISVVAGAVLTIQQVVNLDKNEDYQKGDSPGGKGTKQLKLVMKDSSGKEMQRVSLNNSTTMTSISAGLDDVATALIGIAGRIKVTMGTDIYHKGSCIIMNTTDSGQKQSEFGDIFALEGDRIRVDYGSGGYDYVDVNVTDASGKSVAYSGGSFTMPSSMANLNMIFYYKARSAKVTNNNPERGTLSISKSQYRPGDKVVVKIRSKSGYRFSTKTLAYLYMKDGKMTFQKITKDEDGKYSFIMPFYDVDIRGVFVSKETADSSADTSEFIEYADAEDEEEEEAEEEIPEEELQQMLDVTPLVSRIVAETVLTATVSVSSMTH